MAKPVEIPPVSGSDDADALAVADAVADALAVADAVGEAVAVGLAVGAAVGVALEVEVGLALGPNSTSGRLLA